LLLIAFDDAAIAFGAFTGWMQLNLLSIAFDEAGCRGVCDFHGSWRSNAAEALVSCDGCHMLQRLWRGLVQSMGCAFATVG
jgi:hypothetical protein